MALVHTMSKTSLGQGIAFHGHGFLRSTCKDELSPRLDVLLSASLGQVKSRYLIVIESIDLH